MPEQINIVIADDHPLFRTGLRYTIEKTPGNIVVAEAGSGQEALDAVRFHHPAVVILDLMMPGLNGLDVARQIRREKLPVAIIILTMYDDAAMFDDAMDLGVLGYVLKDSASIDIVQAIRSVTRGKYFIGSGMSDAAFRSRRMDLESDGIRHVLLTLTTTERRILRLVAENRTSAEIAQLLGISATTVNNHRAHVSSKLGVKGNNALLRFALMHRELIEQ